MGNRTDIFYFFSKLSVEDREILKTYLEESIKTSIFGFFRYF